VLDTHNYNDAVFQIMILLVTYLLDLLDRLSVEDFIANEDVTLAISRLLIWTTEPDSLELCEVRSFHLIGELHFSETLSS